MQALKLLHRRGAQLNEHSAVNERLTALAHGVDHLKDILQITLGSDHLLGVIGVGTAESVLVGGVLDDAVFFHRINDASVYADVDTALFAEVTEYSLILSRGRILLQRPDTAVEVISDIHIGVELHNARRDHI